MTPLQALVVQVLFAGEQSRRAIGEELTFHGVSMRMPSFHIADFTRDLDLLHEARHDAQHVVTADPGLSQPEQARMRRMMLRRDEKVLKLGDVG